ncbi:hypothetical protein PTKIN_Ptkin18bG0121500 [Pterospermum kingtungense]
MAFSSSLSTPTPLHHLTRFSYFSHTWTHPSGSILHPHDLLEPEFVLVLTTNTKREHKQSALSSSSSSLSDHHHHCNPLDSSSPRRCTFALMDNSYMPFPITTTTTTTTTTDTTLRQPNTGWSQNSSGCSNFSSTPLTTPPSNSQFHHHHPYSQLVGAPYQTLAAGHSLVPYPVYPCFSIPATNGVQGSGFMPSDRQPKEQERRVLDPYETKVARIKRKLARQRSLSLQRSSSLGASSTQVTNTRRPTSYGAYTGVNNNNNDAKRDQYKFLTPDNKRLRVLLRKELKNSDVGSLGRIVLPKREAEVNLPILYDKEGILVMLKDVYSNQVWTLKYKFWCNNKSRMYVLENTGDFVKQNRLEIGDSLTLYEDESKNLYYSILKVGGVAPEGSHNQLCNNVDNKNDNNNNNNCSSSSSNNNNDIYLPFTCQPRDEDETSIELLIEQLKHKEQQEPNDLMTLPMNAAYSHGLPEETGQFLSNSVASRVTNTQVTATTLGTSSTSLQTSRSVDDTQFNFDDCYWGLDMLPDVNHYNFSL